MSCQLAKKRRQPRPSAIPGPSLRRRETCLVGKSERYLVAFLRKSTMFGALWPLIYVKALPGNKRNVLQEYNIV